MDKYEFKMALEEIDQLIDAQDYQAAADIAETIDWEHVKNPETLCRISDLYKAVGHYEDSLDLLHLARRKAPDDERILYNICELELKLNHYVEALNYHNAFVSRAPEDPRRYVLQYKLLDFSGASLPERIDVLEKLKARAYSQRWAYELANLYNEAGDKRACVRECDTLIRSFGQGRFVDMARTLQASIVENNEGLAVETPVSSDNDEQLNTQSLRETVAAGMQQMQETEKKASLYDDKLSQESDGQIAMAIPESVRLETQITGQINLESIMSEWERVRAAHEQARLKQIRERVLEDTGPMLSNFEREAKQGVLENLERELRIQEQRDKLDIPDTFGLDDNYDVIDEEGDDHLVIDEKMTQVWQPSEVRKAEERRQLDELAMAAGEDVPEEEAYVDEPYYEGEETYYDEDGKDVAEYAKEPAETAAEEAPEAPASEEAAEQDYFDDGEYVDDDLPHAEVEYVEEDYTGDIELPEDMTQEPLAETPAPEAAVEDAVAETPAGGATSFDEMQAALAQALQGEETAAEEDPYADDHAVDVEDGEIASPEEEPVEETPELAPEGEKESRRPVAEEVPAEDEPAEEEAAEEEQEEEPAEEEEAAEEAEGTDAPGTRVLSEEEKELFRPFVHSKKTRRQLSHALDVISLAPYTGNVVITAVDAEEAMNLAKALIKEVRMMDQNFSGKVAKTTADVINRKDLTKALDQIKNGALIVEKASELSTESVQALHRELDKENRGLIVILIDKKKATDRFLRDHGVLENNFNARIDIVELSNDELVQVADKYARECGYAIDEYAFLALHTRISQLQTIDHSVTADEIRAIVDEAISYADKKSPGHLVGALLGKRRDDNDLIILHEKDFLHN